jgi:DNA-binding CsgD family transcriptional regulator
MTQDEVAAALGLTRKTVAIIERQALAKLRAVADPQLLEWLP